MEAGDEASLVPEHARSISPLIVRMRRLLAEALAVGPWTGVIVGLARVDPLAVAALTDEVQERWELNAPASQQSNKLLTIRHEAGGSKRAPRGRGGSSSACV